MSLDRAVLYQTEPPEKAFRSERKRTGVSMAKLVQRLKNVKVQTFISSGPGVPEIAARKRNRGKGTDSNQT